MDKTTIAIGIVVLVIIGGILWVASRSPSVQDALGGALPGGEAPRDHTAEDVSGVVQGVGAGVGSLLQGVASLYGAAGGRSTTGAVK